ncbi:hypothetical protein CEXT_768171 [Caerostris extrusa]|uniref:Uncharacterized protein n=1 Tax=Caerostris extrusa TaxID=172846 RepID=A0AAV4QUQ9_CAEEX|nr:hypothetical protein CEXT_768171 [Caerostris extrusa]
MADSYAKDTKPILLPFRMEKWRKSGDHSYHIFMTTNTAPADIKSGKIASDSHSRFTGGILHFYDLFRTPCRHKTKTSPKYLRTPEISKVQPYPGHGTGTRFPVHGNRR